MQNEKISIEMAQKNIKYFSEWLPLYLKSRGVSSYEEAALNNHVDEDCLSRYVWEGLSLDPNTNFTKDVIDKVIFYINWRFFSKNLKFDWSVENIEYYKEYISFGDLSCNLTVKWSKDLIDRFQSQLSFWFLSVNTSIPFNNELIEAYAERWHWGMLLKNPSAQISEDLQSKYKEYINRDKIFSKLDAPKGFERTEFTAQLIKDNLHVIDNYSSYAISFSSDVVWTKELFIGFKDYLYYDVISRVGLLSSDLILEFKDILKKSELVKNKNCDFNPTVIRSLNLNRIDFLNLCNNSGNFWSIELIMAFEDEWDWISLSSNESVIRNRDIFLKYSDKWYLPDQNEYPENNTMGMDVFKENNKSELNKRLNLFSRKTKDFNLINLFLFYVKKIFKKN